MFCALLGSFAGNIALTFGARGGVYMQPNTIDEAFTPYDDTDIVFR